MYLIMTNLFNSMFGGVLVFKLINLGFDKTELTNQGTILLIPTILVLIIAGAFFMNKNSLMKSYQFLNILNWSTTVIQFFFTLWFASSKDNESMYWILMVLSIISLPTAPSMNFYFAFINMTADKRMGGTAITLQTSIFNFATTIANTVGLQLVNYISFTVFGLTMIVLNSFFLIVFIPTAITLDKTPVEW